MGRKVSSRDWKPGTGMLVLRTPTPASAWSQNLGSRNFRRSRKAVEPIAGIRFNSVLINYYRDGRDRVAWHSDDEKELGQNPVIASVSLGAERKFKLRHKDFAHNGQQAEIMLAHGSLIMMEGPTQHFWKHEIPRTARPVGRRVNLTFRVIDPNQ